MTVLNAILRFFLWPGSRFCAQMGTSPADDSGMLRGFINSVVWGGLIAIVLWNLV